MTGRKEGGREGKTIGRNGGSNDLQTQLRKETEGRREEWRE